MDPAPGRLLSAKSGAAGILSSRASCSFLDHCSLVIPSCHSHSLLLPHHEHRHDEESRRVSWILFASLTLPNPVDLAPSTSSEGPSRVRPSCSPACLCNKSHVSKRQLRGERQHPGYTARHTHTLCPAFVTATNASLFVSV